MRHRSFASALATPLICIGTPVSAQLPVVDISLEHDQANSQLKIFLRANDHDFGEVLSNLVFTVRWPESSPATLGIGSSAWCPPPNQALSLGPSAAVTPGNGFRYRTWTSIGLALLADPQDDGGCEQALLADDWTQVHTININGDPGGTEFIIADDVYTQENNRGYFISLNGVTVTGAIYTFSTRMDDARLVMPADFALAPNPVGAGMTATALVTGGGPWSMDLLDATGKLAGQWHGNAWPPQFEMGELRAGRYLARLISSDAARTSPLVIER